MILLSFLPRPATPPGSSTDSQLPPAHLLIRPSLRSGGQIVTAIYPPPSVTLAAGVVSVTTVPPGACMGSSPSSPHILPKYPQTDGLKERPAHVQAEPLTESPAHSHTDRQREELASIRPTGNGVTVSLQPRSPTLPSHTGKGRRTFHLIDFHRV